MNKEILSEKWFGETYVCALQTTYLSKVFEIFKPEQIKKIIAKGDLLKSTELTHQDLLGLKHIKRNHDTVVLEYSSQNSPKLKQEDCDNIINFLKEVGVDDCAIDCLEVENLLIDFNKYGGKVKTTQYIAKFRNENAPMTETIKISLENKNEDIRKSNRNLFRYRQLKLVYLIAQDQMRNVPFNIRIPVVDLELNWNKKEKTPVCCSEDLNSQQTARAIQECIGDYWCASMEYKLKKDKQWVFVG